MINEISPDGTLPKDHAVLHCGGSVLTGAIFAKAIELAKKSGGKVRIVGVQDHKDFTLQISESE